MNLRISTLSRLAQWLRTCLRGPSLPEPEMPDVDTEDPEALEPWEDPEALEPWEGPESSEWVFLLRGLCESCGTQDRPLNFWHFCRPCMEDMDAAERAEGFGFGGDCGGCGSRCTALNRWNLCRACARNPDRHTFPAQPD